MFSLPLRALLTSSPSIPVSFTTKLSFPSLFVPLVFSLSCDCPLVTISSFYSSSSCTSFPRYTSSFTPHTLHQLYSETSGPIFASVFLACNGPITGANVDSKSGTHLRHHSPRFRWSYCTDRLQHGCLNQALSDCFLEPSQPLKTPPVGFRRVAGHLRKTQKTHETHQVLIRGSGPSSACSPL